MPANVCWAQETLILIIKGQIFPVFLFKIFMVALSSYLHLTNANTKLDAVSHTHQLILRKYRSNRWKKANISLATCISGLKGTA